MAKTGKKAGKKTNSNVSASPWKSIDPMIPIVVLDSKPASGKDMAANPYGKGRKADRKKNGSYW